MLLGSAAIPKAVKRKHTKKIRIQAQYGGSVRSTDTYIRMQNVFSACTEYMANLSALWVICISYID